MPTNYPGALDSFPERILDETVEAEFFNDPNDSIVAVETELGTLPKGVDASVKARLDRMQSEIVPGAQVIISRKYLGGSNWVYPGLSYFPFTPPGLQENDITVLTFQADKILVGAGPWDHTIYWEYRLVGGAVSVKIDPQQRIKEPLNTTQCGTVVGATFVMPSGVLHDFRITINAVGDVNYTDIELLATVYRGATYNVL